MSWTRKLLVVMIAMLLVGTACAGDDDGAAQPDGEAEGGEPIEVASVHVGAEQENFRAVLDAFQEETGIEAGFRSAGDDMAAFLGTQIEGGSPPDVAMIAQPALIDQLAGDGSLIELNDDVVAAIDENFSAAWRDFGSVEGTPYALYFKVSNKSAWWYNVPVFEQAGVQPPETWEELLQTAQTVNASGVPFVSMGGAAGWTLTEVTSLPSAGVPVTTGRMGTVLLLSTARTLISTLTVAGVSSTDSTSRPSMSTGTRSTCGWRTSMPDSKIWTRATARATRPSWLCGPLATTVSSLTRGVSMARPGGTSPVCTSTGTGR